MMILTGEKLLIDLLKNESNDTELLTGVDSQRSRILPHPENMPYSDGILKKKEESYRAIVN